MDSVSDEDRWLNDAILEYAHKVVRANGFAEFLSVRGAFVQMLERLGYTKSERDQCVKLMLGRASVLRELRMDEWIK